MFAVFAVLFFVFGAFGVWLPSFTWISIGLASLSVHVLIALPMLVRRP